MLDIQSELVFINGMVYLQASLHQPHHPQSPFTATPKVLT